MVSDCSLREDATFISLATREDDVVFSSFIDCVVLAEVYALENGISTKRSIEMPLLSIFGNDFAWALRDSIAYSGGYGETFARNFGDVLQVDRGRNALNNKFGPQIHSFPGLGQ